MTILPNKTIQKHIMDVSDFCPIVSFISHPFRLQLPHFKKKKLCYFFFRAVLGSQKNLEEKEGTEISHVSPALKHAEPTPLSTSPTGVVHLLQLMNLH